MLDTVDFNHDFHARKEEIEAHASRKNWVIPKKLDVVVFERKRNALLNLAVHLLTSFQIRGDTSNSPRISKT